MEEDEREYVKSEHVSSRSVMIFLENLLLMLFQATIVSKNEEIGAYSLL